jgi:hypothetical protein
LPSAALTAKNRSMTASQILDALIAALVRRAGGSKRNWRLAIGPVRIYDPATHPHCNWSVSPSGTLSEIAHIETILDDLRLSYPIVMRD